MQFKLALLIDGYFVIAIADDGSTQRIAVTVEPYQTGGDHLVKQFVESAVSQVESFPISHLALALVCAIHIDLHPAIELLTNVVTKASAKWDRWYPIEGSEAHAKQHIDLPAIPSNFLRAA